MATGASRGTMRREELLYEVVRLPEPEGRRVAVRGVHV